MIKKKQKVEENQKETTNKRNKQKLEGIRKETREVNR